MMISKTTTGSASSFAVYVQSVDAVLVLTRALYAHYLHRVTHWWEHTITKAKWQLANLKNQNFLAASALELARWHPTWREQS
eukprot:6393-Heterococcus_DN1.PRE.8